MLTAAFLYSVVFKNRRENHNRLSKFSLCVPPEIIEDQLVRFRRGKKIPGVVQGHSPVSQWHSA